MKRNAARNVQAEARRLKQEKTFQKVLPYLMLAPALIFILVFKIYPMISVYIGSFFRDGKFTFLRKDQDGCETGREQGRSKFCED